MKKFFAAVCLAVFIPATALAVPVCDRVNTGNCVAVDANGNIPTVVPGTFETCTSGNVANNTAACTLAASAGKTTYISSLHMQAGGSTAALTVDCTITGVITGTQTFTFSFGTLNVLTARDILFPTPMPANNTNTTIVVSCPAGGSGNAHATMNAEGFQR